MVDISDPIVWSTIVQTIVLTLTLIIFTLSFRSQNKAMRDQAYQKVLDDYSDSMRMLVERPELAILQIELARLTRTGDLETRTPTPEQLVVRNFVMLLYGIFERIYMLYWKKWIDADTWRQWDRFLKIVAKHPMFEDVHRTSDGMFDKPFQDYVTGILKRTN